MPDGSSARRAGTGRLPGGLRLTWTVADGSRGRRWRSVTTEADGRVTLSLLLEVEPDGSLARLEASAPVGLLTLHPEGETLHGNVVRSSDIRHVALPARDGLVAVDGSPVALAVVAGSVAGRVAVGQGIEARGVAVDAGLRVRDAAWRIERVGERSWRFEPAGGGEPLALELDGDGVPVLGDGVSWPLEVPGEAHR